MNYSGNKDKDLVKEKALEMAKVLMYYRNLMDAKINKEYLQQSDIQEAFYSQSI